MRTQWNQSNKRPTLDEYKCNQRQRTLTVNVYLTPIVLVNVPAKKPTMAKQPYRAPLAASVKATLELMEPPAPSPDKALNIPGQHRHTMPKKTTWISGVLHFWRNVNWVIQKKEKESECWNGENHKWRAPFYTRIFCLSNDAKSNGPPQCLVWSSDPSNKEKHDGERARERDQLKPLICGEKNNLHLI